MVGLVGILGGFAAVGLAIGATLGGGTELALVVGLATPPIATGAAIAAWRGIVGAWFVSGLTRSALRSRGDDDRFRDETKRTFERIRDAGPGALPGAWVVLPVCTLAGLLGGTLMTLAGGPAAGLALVVAAVLQGITLRRLARTGGLLLPD